MSAHERVFVPKLHTAPGTEAFSKMFDVLRVTLGYSRPKLQALVYDILPSTTAVFSYAIRYRKLSANEQFCFLFL